MAFDNYSAVKVVGKITLKDRAKRIWNASKPNNPITLIKDGMIKMTAPCDSGFPALQPVSTCFQPETIGYGV